MLLEPIFRSNQKVYTTVMIKDFDNVDLFLKELKHPLIKEINDIRFLILGADKNISEHIKWNAPSYCYKGEDRITFRFNKKDSIELIFHRGAKVKDSRNFVFEDRSELINWITKDRGTVIFQNRNDIAVKKKDFVKIVKRWMKETV